MDPVNVAAPRLPSDADISHVVDVSLSIVEFFLLKNVSPESRPTISYLRKGLEIPPTIARAILLCTPLSNLEAAGLLQITEPPLPTVECVLTALRKHLTENPAQFWINPQFGYSLHERVWTAYLSFDWDRFEDAPIAVDFGCDDVLLDALADFLLALPDVESSVRPPATPGAAWQRQPLFARLTPRKQGRQQCEVRIDFGPESARRHLFYKPKRQKSLRADYDFIVESVSRTGSDFDLSFQQFRDAVRRGVATRKSTVRRRTP